MESPESLRCAGLCEDHFKEDSFTKSIKKRLKRNAVPIHFKSECSNDNYIQRKKSRQVEIDGADQEIDIQQVEAIEENATPVIIDIINYNDNIVMMDEQPPERLPTKTYGPSNLCFDTPAEEENIMEWIHIEPPRYERIDKSDLPKKGEVEEMENTNQLNSYMAIIDNLKRENARLRTHIRSLRHRLRIRRIPKKPKRKKQKKQLLKKLIHEQELHPVAKAMINLQLHTPNAKYTEEEKNLSRQLYYYSASAFCRLQKVGCNFPGQRTIRRWLEEYDIRPGFCNFIFHKLKEKITQLPMEEKVCALKWDEMYIKSYEEYSSKLDKIEGLVDLGPLDRKSERAKCVFVFCLDSLNARHPWRQPIAYFLSGKCLKAGDIINLLKECLNRLNETGADVQLLTCDQGTCNQSAYAQLGVDSTKPFFTYKEKKYYASFDFPHLVKRLASFLRTHKNIYRDGNIIASYSDFEMTWSIDNSTKGGSNLLSHITEAHIRPNSFEAMNVKRAFQLFSHTFAAAIKTAGHEQELNTNTWQVTADFAERMNNIIDACNSYSLNMKFGGKRPLSSKNSDIEILLTEFVEWCSRWSKSAEIIIQVPCFKGFVITIKAILATYKALVNKNEAFELATGLCNQDSVEHLFSKLRQRGGFNPNPTARMIRLSIRHILSTGYIQTSDKANVQCPETETLINQPSKLTKAIENVMETSNTALECDVDQNDNLLVEDANIIEEYFNYEDFENEQHSSYDDNAVTYFAGFVARQSLEKNNCDKCRNIMMKTPMDKSTANEKYIQFREYPNIDEDAPIITKLVRPTQVILQNIMRTQLLAFNKTWQHYWASTHILNNIVMRCMEETNKIHAT